MRLSTNIVLLLLTTIPNYRMQRIDMYNTTNMYLQEISGYPILFKVMGVENLKFHIPDECKERKICEQIPDYLQEYITEIIRMLSNKNIILHGVEDVEDTARSHTKDTNNIDTQYEDLCSTKQVLYIPKAAPDINNTWHIILNDNQHPQYKFRVEICKINNLSCSFAYFPLDYTSKCIQKYTLRRMMALSEQNEVVERPFQVPSCCTCGMKKTLLQNYETQAVNGFINKMTDHTVHMKINGLKKITLTIPEECKERGFCEHIPNYPQDYMSEIMTLLSNKTIKLNADLDPREHITQYNLEEINTSEYKYLCSSQLEVIHPQAVRDKNNKWYLVLNSKNYPQNYIIEKCRGNPSRPERCSEKAYFSPPFYGECVQKYIERKVFVLKPPFYDYLMSMYFPIPSCCSCEVKREYLLSKD